jgi:hypothetical protein
VLDADIPSSILRAMRGRSRAWQGALARALGAALASAAAGSAAAAPPRLPPEQVFVELAEPLAGSVQRAPIALVELRGRAGASAAATHDIAIAIDLSTSTRLPSGVDVDGDGRVGASAREVTALNWGGFPAEALCDDTADSIAGAELTAVGRLLAGVDPARTRVALVVFGDEEKVETSLGAAPDALAQSLARLDGEHGWYGGTNFAAALRGARMALGVVPGPERRRSVILVTDGYPTLPAPEPLPHEQALVEADRLARARIRVVALALGPEAQRGRTTLEAIVKRTGGELLELERPGDILATLPYLESSSVRALEIENLTNGTPGRAIRMLPDGRFDGFVTLSAGKNRIRIRALGQREGRAQLEREIFYEPPAALTPELERERARLAERLRERTLQVELSEEMRRERAARAKNLKLEAEP